MTVLVNDRLLRALLRQSVDRTPVWMMRQAGRYLPEYRQLRQQVPDFMQFCKRPELACEVTLQPLRRFELDAAIIFSDILTIPDAMGMHIDFQAGKGPVLADPIRSAADVAKLRDIDIAKDLDYVCETMDRVVTALDGQVPVFGFAGSPWTVASYMVEGASSKSFSQIKAMIYQQPDVLQTLLERLTHVTTNYLNAQIAAGARAIMLFDTWGGVLSTSAYQQFSLRYMQQITAQLTQVVEGQKIPVIFFTKNGGQWLELIAASGCDGIGLDWTVDISEAKRRVGARVALQGNLDPFCLFAKPTEIRKQVKTILDGYGHHSGHVFNLGHGIDKDTPITGVQAMIDAVHEFGMISA